MNIPLIFLFTCCHANLIGFFCVKNCFFKVFRLWRTCSSMQTQPPSSFIRSVISLKRSVLQYLHISKNLLMSRSFIIIKKNSRCSVKKCGLLCCACISPPALQSAGYNWFVYNTQCVATCGKNPNWDEHSEWFIHVKRMLQTLNNTGICLHWKMLHATHSVHVKVVTVAGEQQSSYDSPVQTASTRQVASHVRSSASSDYELSPTSSSQNKHLCSKHVCFCVCMYLYVCAYFCEFDYRKCFLNKATVRSSQVLKHPDLHL